MKKIVFNKLDEMNYSNLMHFDVWIDSNEHPTFDEQINIIKEAKKIWEKESTFSKPTKIRCCVYYKSDNKFILRKCFFLEAFINPDKKIFNVEQVDTFGRTIYCHMKYSFLNT